MPVPVPPVNRQIGTAPREFLLECGDDLPVFRVDGADATKVLIVLRDLEQPLARNATSLGDLLEEWHYVVGTLGTAKGNVDDRVVVARLLVPGAVGSSCHREMLRQHRRFVSVPSSTTTGSEEDRWGPSSSFSLIRTCRNSRPLSL